ncbi:phenol hydroxylase subunit P4 [Halopseudomonas phragmitis]|uniref:Phenol hydroxylase n=1 Tax=Halopseudomonas phragmitis TaxID=1931241 RepID=A0A1V0B371_9GAMM|nr:phenol hydroxylase subunit P4 [Halopseudomonas phragmitis]AQZ94355.1 phenol hydroxylase [Halopseudomonas phragmitis]
MSVKALYPYSAEPKDLQANFNGMQLVYVYWRKHLMFCSPFAFLAAPDMPLGDFFEQVLGPAIAAHPDSAGLDFSRVEWQLDDQPFTPDLAASLKDSGIGHKSMLTLTTPGLEGIGGSAT